jgi:hypothetical protein
MSNALLLNMKFSEKIEELFQKKGPKVTVAEILESNQEKLYGFLLVIFSLPVALPLTPPGISVPFSIAVVIVATQVFFNKQKIALPSKLLNAEIDISKNKRFVDLMLKTLRFTERFLRPRLGWVFQTVLRPKLSTIVVILAAVMMALPFPVTNTPPGIAITLIGLGMLEEDGLFGLGGIIAFLLGLILLGLLGYLIIILGWEAVDLFKNNIKSTFMFGLIYN